MRHPRRGIFQGEPPCWACPVAQPGADLRKCTARQCERIREEIRERIEKEGRHEENR